MAESGTIVYGDPDDYAAAFGDMRVNLTITGAGEFQAMLTRLKLEHLEICWLRERLPRIAYLSLPHEQIYLLFPVSKASPIVDGVAIRNRDIVLASRGACMHQRSSGECQWGLISLSPEQFERCGKALTGRQVHIPQASKTLRLARTEMSTFHRLFRQVCHLAEARKKLIEHHEVARALEEQLLYAIINCLTANETDDNPKTRHHHAAVMVRFEATLSKRIDRNINMPALCEEISVPERTLRMCCAEFLGVSPTRYLLLQRLNKARSALRRADPSATNVAEVARNHQFAELRRFVVAYRTTFGESPSTTLKRDREFRHKLPKAHSVSRTLQ
jgi:AraC-like DNA-binding protein